MNDILEIRAHRIGNLAGHMDSNFVYLGEDSKKAEKYGPEFTAYLKRTYQRMARDPHLRIKIIEGLDDVCKNSSPSCPLRRDQCKEKGGITDFLCMHYYNLISGHRYVMEETHAKIKQFQEQHRVVTPLDLLNVEKSTLTGPEITSLWRAFLKPGGLFEIDPFS